MVLSGQGRNREEESLFTAVHGLVSLCFDSMPVSGFLPVLLNNRDYYLAIIPLFLLKQLVYDLLYPFSVYISVA